MGRLIFGMVLALWGVVIVVANSGDRPDANFGDLLFGFILLVAGGMLILRGASAIRAEERAALASSNTHHSSEPPGVAATGSDATSVTRSSATRRISESVAVGVLISVVSAVIVKILNLQ